MESVNKTVNNTLYSASHAIWGETHPEHMQHGEEPRSGFQGRGSIADPYDAGNRDMDPGTPANPGVMTTPQRYDAPELTAAVNYENEESQLGAATAATTSPSGFDLSRLPRGPEEEEAPVGMDPVSTDASALSSTLNQSNVSGIPGGPLMTRDTMDSDRLGRTLGPRAGAINQTSLNPAMIGAGLGGGSAIDMSKADMEEADDFGVSASSNKAVKGFDLGGGSSSGTGSRAGTGTTGTGTGDRSTTATTEMMADGVDGKQASPTAASDGVSGGRGGEKTGASPTDTMADAAHGNKPSSAAYGSGEKTMASPTDTMAGGGNKTGGNEAQGEEGVHPKSNVSKEALRGPEVPPPRAEYEREKNMDIRGSIGRGSSGPPPRARYDTERNSEIRRSISGFPSANTNKPKDEVQESKPKTSTFAKMKDKLGFHHATKT